MPFYRNGRVDSGGSSRLGTFSVNATLNDTLYSAQDVNLDGFSSVTISPMEHTSTAYYSNGTDLGTKHTVRYINTQHYYLTTPYTTELTYYAYGPGIYNINVGDYSKLRIYYQHYNYMYTSTTLWSNPDRSVGFAAQSVTLSDSINNYDLIRVRFDGSTTKGIIQTVYLQNFASTSNSNYGVCPCGAMYAVKTTTDGAPASGIYCRRFYATSSTTVYFQSPSKHAGSGTQNKLLLPVDIVGIKLN